MPKVNPQEYATLFLARAIIEGDVNAVKAALDAKANPEAFWIDGKTTLTKLAKARGPAELAKLFTPVAIGKLPNMKDRPDGPAIWTPVFVEFVVKRGYAFSRRTTPRSGDGGTDKGSFDNARTAVKFITSTRHDLVDATCHGSTWTLYFDADWRGDKRIVGFRIRLETAIDGPEMLKLFHEKQESGEARAWPADDAPEIQAQKEDEAQRLGHKLLYDYADPSFEEALAALRKGANPFARDYESEKSAPCAYYEDKKALMLIHEVRSAVGAGPGWRERIKPFLTKQGVEALMQRAELKAAIPAGTEKHDTRSQYERDKGRL